jgi:hypothetical protein
VEVIGLRWAHTVSVFIHLVTVYKTGVPSRKISGCIWKRPGPADLSKQAWRRLASRAGRA